MTRNSKKLQREPVPEYVESTTNVESKVTPQPKPDNPFGLPFVVGVDTVILPSEGKLYPKGSSFHGVKQVEIRHMTAREEDLLSTADAIAGQENVFDKLINILFVDKSLSAEDMLEEDKMSVLLKARETGYGKEYRTMSYCENCKEATEMVFDISKVGIRKPKKEIEYNPEENCFTLELPVTGLEVKVMKLSASAKNKIEEEKQKKQSLNLDFNYTLSYLNNIILSVNGVYDRNLLNKFFEIMPAADAKFLLNFEKDVTPTIDTTQEVECTKCGTVHEKEVPLSWAFFRTEF